LEQGDNFGDLYPGKEECKVIEKIGKIVEMSSGGGPQLRIAVFRAIIGTR
jgi:hypothetical protein